MKVKYVILGGGPSGLSFANRLLQNGETSFIVIEKEPEAGGLCRSKTIDSAPLDIGGGHFLDTTREGVNRFLFNFMPLEEWALYTRNSHIYINEDEMIGHPFESNLWQLPRQEQRRYLSSIAKSYIMRNRNSPELFTDWIYWKLGDRIAESYMIPYNKKMFGEALDELGTYWLDKLPDVSFWQTLLSCINKKPYGKQPGHQKFYYPKQYGYGELWKRLAQRISDKIVYCANVTGLDFERSTILLSNGTEISGDIIVTTIPWNEFKILKGMPIEIANLRQELKHTSIVVSYIKDNMNTDAQWIYYPDLNLDFHRILVRKNFYNNALGYWKETNYERFRGNLSEYDYLNEYAYPINTMNKKKVIEELLVWARERNVIGLGRWGEHEHYNSDVAVERAIKLADQLTKQI